MHSQGSCMLTLGYGVYGRWPIPHGRRSTPNGRRPGQCSLGQRPRSSKTHDPDWPKAIVNQTEPPIGLRLGHGYWDERHVTRCGACYCRTPGWRMNSHCSCMLTMGYGIQRLWRRYIRWCSDFSRLSLRNPSRLKAGHQLACSTTKTDAD